MAQAGAVGGMKPATAAGPHDGGAKAGAQQPDPKGAEARTAETRAAEAKAAETRAAEGKPSAPPLPETSGRAPPDTAVALAATLAGLKPGQELRGTVRLLPGHMQALLTTPHGDFLIDPATGLEPDSPLALVLLRADRAISALLLAHGRAAFDPPRPVQLTLVSVHNAPATPPQGAASATTAAPAPLPATAASSLTSLLPGEAIFLRGGGHPSLPSAPGADAPAPTAPTGQGASAGAARPPLSLPLLTDMPARIPATAAPARAVAAPAGASPAADPLAALFNRGAMPLTLQTDAATAPARTLSASLLAAAAPGETSALTHPPSSSPLARLAETGRLMTATVLPPQDNGAGSAAAQQFRPVPGMPAAHPVEIGAGAAARPTATQPATAQPPAAPGPAASGTTAPPAASPTAVQNQRVQLGINGTGARIALPSDLPAPAPGTQLVFLVTKGHEALRTLPPAQQAQVPLGQASGAPAALQATDRNGAPAQSASTGVAMPVPDSRASEARAVESRSVESRTTDGRHSTAAPRTGEAAPASAAPQTPTQPTPAAGNAPARTEAPQVLWVPGMPLPASALSSGAPAPASVGEALLMALMQALGRKGFAATSRDVSNPRAEPETGGADGAPGLPALARLLAAAASPAAPAMQTRQAQETPPPANAPEALPLTMTLQTPQGQVPLVFLVWQPVSGDEEGRSGDNPSEGEPDVCFAVDVEFESIGRLRLRGTVGRSHLDLGVETEKPLGAALHHAASQDFTEAVEAGGMTGTLVFRHRQGA